jgi:beta-glucosidase
MARRVLRLIVRTGRLDGNPKAMHAALNTQAHNDIAKELAAESIILLKNSENLLPINYHMKHVAIIGAPAISPTIQGGGSSQVAPFKITTPLEALQAALGEDFELTYAQGVDHEPELPIADYRFFSVDAKKPSVFGLRAKYYTQSNWHGDVVLEQNDKVFAKLGFGKVAQQDSLAFSAEWTGFLHAPRTGTYEFSIQHSNPDIEFLLDDKVLVDASTERNPVDLFGMLTMNNRTFSANLEAGQSYPVCLRYSQPAEGAIPGFNILKFNMRVPAEERQIAIENASKADIAIVFVGSGTTEESEGMDRASMRLSSAQDELVESVCAVNKDTVVVINSGACIEMPWADKVSAIVQMWLPGQAGGAAIADVLLGRANPSGKLPVTFPVRYEDNPTYPHYPGGKRVQYGEDIFVGYRYYDKVGIAPLFPFGHGLSYTNFSYNNLIVSEKISPDSPVKVSIDIENVGACEGAEVVQLYIANHASPEAQAKAQLRKFKKVSLKPNQSKRIDFVLGFKDFAYYDTSLSCWVVAPGEYEIKLGSSSRDFRASAKINIPEGYC